MFNYKKLFSVPRTGFRAIGTQNKDIIKLMEYLIPIAVEQTSDAAFALKMAKKTSLLDVWKFAKNAAVYKKDPNFTQVVQAPNSLIHSGAGDCKSFALLCFGLAKNLGYKPCLRFVSYNQDKTPTHVYCVCGDIALDATIEKFEELPYKSKMDIFGIFGVGKKPKKEKKGVVKKIAAAPLRAAFLSLVKVNFRGLATKLDKVSRKNNKLETLWKKFGGKYSDLLGTVSKGKEKKALLGSGKKGIGAEPVTLTAVTALITAALPLITAANALFKVEGVADSSSDLSLDTSALEVSSQDAAFAQQTAKDVLTGEATTEEATTETTGGGLPLPLLIGAGALAMILLNKK